MNAVGVALFAGVAAMIGMRACAEIAIAIEGEHGQVGVIGWLLFVLSGAVPAVVTAVVLRRWSRV